MSTTLENLEMLIAFEDWAGPRSYDLTRDGDAFQNLETRAAWLGFQAAHGPDGCKPDAQQLYAEIKKSSKYAHQAVQAQRQGMPYPFQVHIEDDKDGYVVLGGYGGFYRLEDVDLFVIDGLGRKVRIN